MSRPKKRIKATYDAASTTNNNKRRWQYTDALSANQANTKDIRHKLIYRARYERSNNTYCDGLITTLAQDAIGTGPRLQLKQPDQIYKDLERSWVGWCKAVNYCKKLITMNQGKTCDGESFGFDNDKEENDHPVKLYIQLFEPEQIQSHHSNNSEVDGVWLDEFGEPKEFNLLEKHPGDLGGAFNLKGRRVPASSMIHYAHISRAGQVRGIPLITPALELFVQLRAFTLSVLASAETAANFSAVLETTAGANDDADEVEAFLTWDIERNTMKALPFGWKMNQLRAEQPIANYPEFKAEILNEIARCLQIPYNIAAGNSSSYNYASGRLDHARYFKSIQVERESINQTINDPIFKEFVKEWAQLNGVDIRQLDLSHTWQYDGYEHADPVKNANGQRIRMESGVSNLSIECAKDGYDWEEVKRQQLQEEALEMKLREELGLPVYDKKDVIIQETVDIEQ